MTFREMEVAGVWTLEVEPRADERGFFARTWCRRALEAHGLGAIYDVTFDARRGSATFGRWVAAELTDEVFYQISEFHHPESGRGIRWDDPGVAVAWPLADVTVSPRDAAWPRLADL